MMKPQIKPYTTVLTIAGSDPSAGAGIQADLKTFSALECYGLSVITALTAQNTEGVQAIYPIPVDFVRAQLDSIFNDIKVSIIKIGMLHNAPMVKMLADYFSNTKIPIILDPVMVAKGGHSLLEDPAILALRDNLLPLATIATPNLSEAMAFCNQHINSLQAMADAAKALSNKHGAASVLVKGGHFQSYMARDCLYLRDTDNIQWFDAPRIQTRNTHGTGCTLSAAIAAFMAHGQSIQNAIEAAKRYLSSALLGGAEFELGGGTGPLHHFAHLWES